jgi:hypothetical protein
MSEKFNPLPHPLGGSNAEKRERQHNPIVERIKEEAGIPKLVETLIDMPNTDLQSLLLEVFEEKADDTGVAEINTALERNPFVQMSSVDQRDLLRFDSIAYGVLPPMYKGVELSPLVPFATNRMLAGINQKRILSTTRNSEVISDPTTALALQCAQERAYRIKVNPKDATSVALAASQRVIRQDPVKKEGYSQHFKTFTLAVAGRDIGFERFEKENLLEHLRAFLTIIKLLNESGEYAINDITVAISDVSKRPGLLESIDTEVLKELQEVFTETTFTVDSDRASNYYKSLCYSIAARVAKDRAMMSIAGGGITSWTEMLVGSKKERLLVGSIGSETICRHFKK